jgi:hypothetical protein
MKGGSGASRSASRAKPATGGRTASSRSRSGSSARGGNGGSRSPATRRRDATTSGGVARTIKGAVAKVRGPALALGATAAGVAGGVALRGRQRRKTVLGVSVPRNPRLPDVDIKAVAKRVGRASLRFGETTKTVSRDIERVGEQAERIGKILS